MSTVFFFHSATPWRSGHLLSYHIVTGFSTGKFLIFNLPLSNRCRTDYHSS